MEIKATKQEPQEPQEPMAEAEHTELDPVSTFVELLYHHTRAMDNVSIYYQQEDHTKITQILRILNDSLKAGNKIVFVGCGKSFKVICKSVAMLNSLGLHAVYLHPTEAMHGDLGVLKNNDVLLLCSSSGETSELVVFLEYLKQIKLLKNFKILVTSKQESLLGKMADEILHVPQPAEFQEATLQKGLNSPTVSTTLMLTVLDCLCVSLSELYYGGDSAKRRQCFQTMHPGGGIGKKVNGLDGARIQAIGSARNQETVGHLDSGECSEFDFVQAVVLYDYVVVNNKEHLSNNLRRKYKKWNCSGERVWSEFMDEIAG